jgi:hypothetical protein
VRTRRNFDNLSSVLAFIGPGEVIQINDDGVFVLVLDPNGGLENASGELKAKVTAPITVGSPGIGLAFGHGLKLDGGILVDTDALFTYNETPTGTINGVNDTFTLAGEARAGTTRVFLNGVFMALGEDYTLSDGDTLTFIAGQIPQTGDRLRVHYEKIPVEQDILEVDTDALFAWNETPAGDIDGVNDTFALAGDARPGTVRVFLNGVFMAVGEDYDQPSAGAVRFLAGQLPQTGDRVRVHYEKEPP